MAVPLELRFGACVVHAQRHEVLRDGQVQDIPPKAFELLLFLLRERHRAVAKGELVAALWQQQAVSDSVLARTLMKVRQAIGDSATQPVWIKTIHGYGYRFVGEVIEVHPPGAAAQQATRHENVKPGVRQRIGVLPCENQTGDATLDWTQLGLMALVGHALEADARLDVVPMQTVLEAVSRLPASTPAQERVQQAQQALGLAWVVHASLRRQGTVLWLDYQLVAACGLTRGGSVRETAAVAMGERFAHAISAGLFPGEGVDVAFESRDPFINQAFARAIELWGQQQLKSAATLFDMVCEREPGSLIAQLWRVRTLAGLCDQTAEQAGNALLAQATARGDARLQAMVHLTIGQAIHLGRGDADGAVVHYGRAQALAQDLPDEWVGQVQLHLAYVAHSRHQIDEARRCYRAADAAFRAAGNPFQLGQIQLHLAMLAETSGDLLSALQHAQDGVALLEAQRRHAYAEVGRGLLAILHAALGRHDRALDIAAAMLERLNALQSPQVAVISAVMATRVFGELGDVASMQRAAALSDSLTPGDLGPRVAGPKWETACHLALWQGDLAGLRATVVQAAAAPRQHPEALLAMYLLQLRAEAAAGCFHAAVALRERIAAHPLATAQVDVQAVLDRAQAAEQLARGDAAGALATLLSLVDCSSLGREHARARIDAAWLLVEAGDRPRATALLAGAGGWRNEHPAGLAVQARLCHAQGQAGQARELQQQALDRFRGTVPTVHHDLLRAYGAPSCDEAPALPTLARLASDSWLPAMAPAP
jgi:DNA-binding winged helix-turn-helix (wHTH) protein/tetratricopeptide (TPR) repeat protein